MNMSPAKSSILHEEDVSDDDPFARCTANKDRCEVKGDAKCSKRKLERDFDFHLFSLENAL